MGPITGSVRIAFGLREKTAARPFFIGRGEARSCPWKGSAQHPLAAMSKRISVIGGTRAIVSCADGYRCAIVLRRKKSSCLSGCALIS
jgi:hypothetical protein